MRSRAVAAALSALAGSAPLARLNAPAPELWRQVEIVRTAHGVPHIRAENLRAAGYALAWLQLEDYGPRTALNVLRAHGQMATLFGRDSIESDFVFQRARARAVETYHLLDQETRDLYDGFAAGIDRYVELHGEEFPAGMPADFTGYDVATLDVGLPAYAAARRFLARMEGGSARGDTSRGSGDAGEALDASTSPDVGSNAWAFAPSRTKSGKAILLRNPHLAWSAGYYEAQLTVPGVVDFYGDFRIGGPFAVVGGFNRYLGWATTNNAQRRDEIYALDVDSSATDHILLDGASLPLARELVTVAFRNGPGLSTETRETWSTPLGPVILRADGKVYIVRTAGDGEFRGGEQFLRMMRASSLAEWKDAMRMRARVTSNFTYADRAGNILYVWNAALPLLPHPSGGDTVAIPVHATGDAWTRYVPFDSLPQFLNPRGGYVHNENNSPHFTNVRGPIDTTNAYPNFQPPDLSLRAQLAIQLVGGTNKLSLEDVVRLKFNYRMLLADRVKADLMAAVKAHCADRRRGRGAGAAGALGQYRQRRTAGAPRCSRCGGSDTRSGRRIRSRSRRVWSAGDPLRDATRPGRPGARRRCVRLGGAGDGAPLRELGRGLGGRAPGAARIGGRSGWRLLRRVRLLPGAHLRP